MSETPAPAATRTSAWPFAAGGLIALTLVFNLTVAGPVMVGLSHDARNDQIVLAGYRSFGLSPTEISLDLWSISSTKAPIDLFRCLFQAAAALKDRHFSKVNLARNGKTIFVLSGDDFQELGRAYDGDENPVYLIRTLPEKLLRPDGTPAYEVWEGGILGVLGAQLKDGTDFADGWITGRNP